ncbi:hypothetical protein FQN54_006515 [Arachnomyces sp. PD_36]|nr:hypothetical protein FQN54_006515 [Arachnomyces sp. PD_36]
MSRLESMADEVQLRIVAFLDGPSILKLGQTCTRYSHSQRTMRTTTNRLMHIHEDHLHTERQALERVGKSWRKVVLMGRIEAFLDQAEVCPYEDGIREQLGEKYMRVRLGMRLDPKDPMTEHTIILSTLATWANRTSNSIVQGTVPYRHICDSADLGSMEQIPRISELVEHVRKVGLERLSPGTATNKTYDIGWIVVRDEYLNEWCAIFQEGHKEALKLRAVYVTAKEFPIQADGHVLPSNNTSKWWTTSRMRRPISRSRLLEINLGAKSAFAWREEEILADNGRTTRQIGDSHEEGSPASHSTPARSAVRERKTIKNIATISRLGPVSSKLKSIVHSPTKKAAENQAKKDANAEARKKRKKKARDDKADKELAELEAKLEGFQSGGATSSTNLATLEISATQSTNLKSEQNFMNQDTSESEKDESPKNVYRRIERRFRREIQADIRYLNRLKSANRSQTAAARLLVQREYKHREEAGESELSENDDYNQWAVSDADDDEAYQALAKELGVDDDAGRRCLPGPGFYGAEGAYLWVYGLIGHGKSHLLAALTYFLTAQSYRVVYPPDSRVCYREPARYLQESMLFAWADKPGIIQQIIDIVTMEDQERTYSV